MAVVNILTVMVAILSVVTWTRLKSPKPKIQENIKLNSSYDYIIVGSGSGGGVVTTRLSEDPSVTVLLLEAGPSDEHYDDILVPANGNKLHRTEVDWKYATIPQKESLKVFKDNIVFWPRGRVLGGTSSINGMAYVRGSRYDYDEWAAEGCDGWSYKDVLPYFIKSEDNRVPWLQDSPYHGKGGPLKVSPGQVTELNAYYSKAMQELGYDIIDCNGENQIGYEPLTLTTMNGVRCSTSTCFLQLAYQWPNLHISVNSHVTKVLIKDKSAFAVEFIRGGRKHRIHARREIILSAGAINTPQLLMLSGIGPKNHLEALKIPVVADLPVGRNLQDHIFVLLYFYPNISLTVTPNKADTLWNNILYKTTGTGYFSSSLLEGNAFFHTTNKSKNAYPDMQIVFISAHYPGMERGIATSTLNYKKETEENILKIAERNRNAFLLVIALTRPKSKGTITLQSTDPFDYPLIDPQYLTDKSDVDTLVKGLKIALEIGNTESFKQLGIYLDDTHLHFSECTHYEKSTDDYFECIVHHYAVKGDHPTATCRMGKTDDPTAVVDSDLRVKGISNLRVADASVMRNVIAGTLNAPTIMIGEKAADLIKGIDSVKDIKIKLKNVI